MATKIVVEQDGDECVLSLPRHHRLAFATTTASRDSSSSSSNHKRLRTSYVIVEEEDDESSNEGHHHQQQQHHHHQRPQSSPSPPRHHHPATQQQTSSLNGDSPTLPTPPMYGNAGGISNIGGTIEGSNKQLIKGERRYPCGFPGCKWVFTRSNHVLRHHQRVHPGFKPTEAPRDVSSSGGQVTASSPSSGLAAITINSNQLRNSGGNGSSNSNSSIIVGSTFSPVGNSNSSQQSASFKCDYPGCEQLFKTLTLLTRHKRYVHLTIAIQEQLSYFNNTNQNGHHSQLSVHKPFICENPSCEKSFARRDHLERHMYQAHGHPLLASSGSSGGVGGVGSGGQQQHYLRRQLLLAAACKLESQDEDDEEDQRPISELEPEVVLQVDENKEWTPDNGTVDLVPNSCSTSSGGGSNNRNSHATATATTASAASKVKGEPRDDEEVELRPSDDGEEEEDDDDEMGTNHSYESFTTAAAAHQLQVNSVSGSEADDSLVQGLKPKRPYVCDVPGCDKSYTKHSHLVRHKVETHKMQKPEPKQRGAGTNFIPPPPINLASRPFVCDYPGCRWSFKRQYHLDRHFMTHRLPNSSRGGDGEGSGGDGSGGPLFSSTFSDEDNDGALNSPNIITSSSTKGDYSSYSSDQSKGTSLLSPSPSLASSHHQGRSDHSVVPTKFNWPQLVKDKLFCCAHSSCDLRFKNQTMAEHHYRMTHSGTRHQSADTKCLSNESLKASSFKLGNEFQVIPLSSLGGKPKACSTPEVSLLRKSRESSGTMMVGDDVQHQALHFSQLKLLQALTRGSNSGNNSSNLASSIISIHGNNSNNNNNHNASSPMDLDDEDDALLHISASNDSFTEEEEKEQLLRNWVGKQRKPREKGIFPCDIPGCDKKFGRNCELTRHKLNHMDVWPFNCDWPGCGRKFKRKDVFKNHQRTHRKEDGAAGQDDDMDDGIEDLHEIRSSNDVKSHKAILIGLEGSSNEVHTEGDDIEDDEEIIDSE